MILSNLGGRVAPSVFRGAYRGYKFQVNLLFQYVHPTYGLNTAATNTPPTRPSEFSLSHRHVMFRRVVACDVVIQLPLDVGQ